MFFQEFALRVRGWFPRPQAPKSSQRKQGNQPTSKIIENLLLHAFLVCNENRMFVNRCWDVKTPEYSVRPSND